MSRTRRIVALALAALALAPAAAALELDELRSHYEGAVVGLNVTYQAWDEDRPWVKREPSFRSAGAVVVDDGVILTTANMLDGATLVQLEIFGEPTSVEPRPILIDRSINLALLAVDDETVRDRLRPVAIADETPASGVLRTVRWRRGQLESAASRIVRFEVERTWTGRVEHAFLHMRTDLSGGGWAEPVFLDDRLVGITVSQSELRSRALPAEVLRAFAERASSPDAYPGFATLGVMWQVNRDPALTAFLGQTGVPRGIIIRQVPWGSSGCGVLRPRDILLEIDGYPIDAEGYFQHERFGRLQFGHLLAMRHLPGDVIPITVLRDGRELHLEMTARAYPAELDLVPSAREGGPPFTVVGGLIMRELDVPYLTTWGNDWGRNAPLPLLSRYYFRQEAQTPERRRVVLITAVLPSPFNFGYQQLRDQVVDSINGRPIGRIEDVEAALEHPEGRFHVIRLTPDAARREIVLDALTLDTATAEMLEQYSVPARAQGRAHALPEGGGECPGDF